MANQITVSPEEIRATASRYQSELQTVMDGFQSYVNAINKLSNDPWKSYILTIESDKVYISGGALQGIKVGDQFTVYKRGSVVVNPQTNIPIELPGTQVAKITVEQVIAGTELTEMSIARIVEGELTGTDFSTFYIREK